MGSEVLENKSVFEKIEEGLKNKKAISIPSQEPNLAQQISLLSDLDIYNAVNQALFESFDTIRTDNLNILFNDGGDLIISEDEVIDTLLNEVTNLLSLFGKSSMAIVAKYHIYSPEAVVPKLIKEFPYKFIGAVPLKFTGAIKEALNQQVHSAIKRNPINLNMFMDARLKPFLEYLEEILNTIYSRAPSSIRKSDYSTKDFIHQMSEYFWGEFNALDKLKKSLIESFVKKARLIYKSKLKQEKKPIILKNKTSQTFINTYPVMSELLGKSENDTLLSEKEINQLINDLSEAYSDALTSPDENSKRLFELIFIALKELSKYLSYHPNSIIQSWKDSLTETINKFLQSTTQERDNKDYNDNDDRIKRIKLNQEIINLEILMRYINKPGRLLTYLMYAVFQKINESDERATLEMLIEFIKSKSAES